VCQLADNVCKRQFVGFKLKYHRWGIKHLLNYIVHNKLSKIKVSVEVNTVL
jgi:hypothetical protein